jgi:hypothetical protein
MRRALIFLLLAGAAAGETVESGHYRLESEGSRAEAEEFARVLETAYRELSAYFEAEPKLREGEKLLVRFFETREAWAGALRAVGAGAPAGAGGMYWEANRTAYLYRQPTRLFTRALLIHEATHQFHFLARTRNRSPAAEWYKEGLAECLGWHHWDGRELALGVLPVISLEDYPAQALRELGDPRLDLAAIVEGRAAGSRPVCWAIYRHLSTGDGGKPLRGFEKLAAKLDGGAKPSSGFWRTFGQPAAYRKRLVAWLEAEQQPFVPVFNEWEGLGPDRIRGFAPVVSACRLRARATRLQATLEVPRGDAAWRGGGLLHHAGPEDYTIFLVDRAGILRVDRRNAGRWETLHEGAGPGPSEDGNYRFEILVEGRSVRVVFGGMATHGPWDVAAPALGLALDGCDLVFSGLAWK